jgi:hypothetical protein
MMTVRSPQCAIFIYTRVWHCADILLDGHDSHGHDDHHHTPDWELKTFADYIKPEYYYK